MPTGYTHKLYEGEEQTFAEFVMSCARAFGATITMRDMGPDAPIPEEFTPDSYHADALAEAEERLAEAKRMSVAEARRRAEEDRQKAIDARREIIEGAAAKRARYELMRSYVRDWTPPTPDHQGLKDFMEKQLTESIDFDCSTNWLPDIPAGDPTEWRAAQVRKAEHDIEYHQAEYAKDVERAEQRTAWVAALRSSLRSPAARSGG